jgi:GTP-binding protein
VAKIAQVLTFHGLQRTAVDEAAAGDIVAVTGIAEVNIGLTICDPENAEGLPPIQVDEPTLAMNFQVNTSPLAGREGKFVTSRQIRERLEREAIHNVALRVEPSSDPDKFVVFGRGELHLGVLLENMRREGFELAVSRPRVVIKQIDGAPHEPYEQVTVDADADAQGDIMSALGSRGAELKDMQADGRGRIRLDYMVPSRGLIGFQTEFRTMTRGTGLLHHVFDHYGPVVQRELGQRANGVLIANGQGTALAYSLFTLQERGRLCIGPGEEVYEGMIIGLNNRDNDLVVNPLKGKKLTNMRAAGKDENVVLTPPIRFSLEQAMEFIDDDELIEVTPSSIRLRKRNLRETDRKRSERETADQGT